MDESLLLGIPANCYALVREVCLVRADEPLVYARTVIPLDSLRGARRRLSNLGTRPLGEVIFSYPGLRRELLEVASVPADSWVRSLRETVDRDPVAGRRTLYSVAGSPLLVAEIFLPAVLVLEQERG